MVGTYQALICIEAAGLLCMMLIGNVSVNHQLQSYISQEDTLS